MKKAVISNRIYINRTKELHDLFISKLEYRLPPKKPGLPADYECDVTRINKDILTLPSGRLDLIPEDYEIVDNRIVAPATFPQFKFTLRESQQEIGDAVIDSCIIQANPSWGKTFMGIYLATKFKQKTLVVVHTQYLRDQWINETKKTLGIEAGIIGGGVFKTDSPIVIATIQTLRNRILDIASTFGLIIVDECHHVPATVFKSIVDKFKARYKIGLTATPWRKDGRHVMLQDYFGGLEAYYKADDENKIDPEIIICNSEIPFNSNPNIPWGTRLNELYSNPSYMELVLNLSQAQVDRGHLVLTVADRTEFLETCADVLDNSALIIGRTEDRDFLSKGLNPVFGSSKIFTEGVNIPQLSSLVMGMPINNRTLLEQLLGRISRKHKDKLQPEAIDITLVGKTGKNQAIQRLNYYMEKNYKIRYI